MSSLEILCDRTTLIIVGIKLLHFVVVLVIDVWRYFLTMSTLVRTFLTRHRSKYLSANGVSIGNMAIV